MLPQRNRECVIPPSSSPRLTLFDRRYRWASTFPFSLFGGQHEHFRKNHERDSWGQGERSAGKR